jgi:hypothetical protein
MKKLYKWQRQNQIPMDRNGRESLRKGKHACNRGWKPGPVKITDESK